MFVLEGMYIAPDGLESEKIRIGVDDTAEGYCRMSTHMWYVAIQAFRETFDQRQLVLPVATTIFAGHIW